MMKINSIWTGVALSLAGAMLLWGGSTKKPPKARYNRPGNLIITDQDNGRVVEVDTNSHTIAWHFGDGGLVAGKRTIVGPRDAERFNADTLITAGGIAPGIFPECTNGCPDNRVLMVTRSGHIIWQYGQAGVTGAGENELNTPVAAMMMPGRKVLITDQGNQRVILVSRKGTIRWQYGTSGVSGVESNQLSNPSAAQQLHSGNVLIADTGNDRVIEVNRHNLITWHYGEPGQTNLLNHPTYVCRLGNGNTLITDSLNSRVIELDKSNDTVFAFVTSDRPGSTAQPQPTHAIRVRKGGMLIADQFNHQIIGLNASGTVVFAHGTLGIAGHGTNQLNAPCDVKMVKDFTGLTDPHAGSGFDITGAVLKGFGWPF